MFHLSARLKKIYLRNVTKYIIWDFDGTLYQSEALGQDLKQFYFRLTNSSPKFNSYTKKFGSWSSAAHHLTQLSENRILDLSDKKIDKTKYLKPNPDIVNFIEKSSKKYHHLIFSNSTSAEILTCLPLIGFNTQDSPLGPFEKIFSRDITHLLKPDPALYSQITSYTQSPKYSHLFIGDSINHDIAPALKLGFNALPIWELASFFKT